MTAPGAGARVGVARDPALAGGSGAYGDSAALDALLGEAIRAAGLAPAGGAPVLSGIVRAGSTVLLKPNWVYHRNEGGHGLDCLNTHPAFILAAVRAAAACRPSRILIGDSPIQGCDLDWIAGDGFAGAAREAAGGVPVLVLDFRKARLPGSDLAAGRLPTERDEAGYVLFDLGRDSLLEPISRPEGRFRVTMYDPRVMARAHRPGVHRYLLCREALEADVFLNLAKLKTHRKAGVTIALKNLVGINGNKDFLPHHRIGGTWTGGDCYPGFDPIRRAAEYCLDRANAAAGTPEHLPWRRRALRLVGLKRRLGLATDLEGGWHGNDTCWRMALDLNRALLYGGADGTLAAEPRRRIVTLVDAVVAGQGEGPLAPEPLPMGSVLAGDDSPALDWVGASLLGLDPASIPLVREAFRAAPYPLTRARPESIVVGLRGRDLDVAAAAREIGRRAKVPAGWRGRCEAAA